jgi:hypothetical protein
MQMPAQIICFEVEDYQFKRGPTSIPLLRLVDTTATARLREIVDFELSEDQRKKLPPGDLSGQPCEVGIEEIFRGVSGRLRARGKILSLNGNSF